MTMTDPIDDMLSRLRNASTAIHAEVSIQASKHKDNIQPILTHAGYVEG